jgi:hypothetical protein
VLPTNTLKLLADQTAKNALATLMSEPDLALLTSGTSADSARASNKIAGAVNNEAERLLATTYHWLISNSDIAKADAKRRALHLSKWDPRGATGVWYQDQAARSIAWSLALAYDWLYAQWSPEEKQLLLDAIRPRVVDMLGKPVQGYPSGWAGLDGGTKLDRLPYDSHGVTTMARLAVICSALVGHGPVFDDCFRQVVPRYVARPIPWGGDDGGFANGTAYAQWGMLYTHFPVWDLLKYVVGSDLWQSKWATNHLQFLAYFLPPGSPAGLFGDGAEGRWSSIWATQASVYAAHYSAPLGNWYADSQNGEDALAFPALVSPQRIRGAESAKIPPATPNSVHIPSIGWVAMHSDLGERSRTSVYFKSSPFGSFNHSHADQNSFVIHARGSALAIDSGYYDYYGSPHWHDWYKQTRAHNAITFDDGQGQLHDTLAAKGRIVKFENKGDYDIATGDAVVAYGGALTQALRTIVFLKPNTIIVMDNLASKTPRTWEWNLHAAAQMKEIDARHLEVETNGVRLCTNLVYAPNGAFAQTDRFSTAPQGSNTAQWHARFSTTTKTETARFIAVLGVDCAGADASVRDAGGKLVLRVAGREVVFETAEKVVVQ